MLASGLQSVCIVGTGAQTAVGQGAPATAAAARAGIAAMGNHPFMVDQMGAPMVVCAVPNLGVDLDAVERFLQLALTPAREALAPVLQHSKARLHCSVFVALPEQRPGMPEHFENTFAEKFASVLAKDINIQQLVVNSLGHAGGLYFVEQALSLLQSGKSQFCLIGGVDSYLEPETLEWLDDLEQLHSETTIWGFCPGEGAGFCLLTTTDRAASLGLPIATEIISAASAKEKSLCKASASMARSPSAFVS